MAILSSTGTFTSGILIGDEVNGLVPNPTTSGGSNISSCLELQSTTKAFVPPRMTTGEINAIANPIDGMQVYNTSIASPVFRMGGIWEATSALALTTVSQKLTTLDQADIIALNDTPITLVPAPGVGLLTVILKVSLVNAFETAAFAGGSSVLITYSDGTTYATDRLIPALFMKSAVVALYTTGGVIDNIAATGAGVDLTGLVNASVLMQNSDILAPFTGGNVGSKIIVNVWYMTVVMQ